MQCEQFIVSLSEIIASSPNIEQVVTLDELRFLMDLGNGINQPQCLRTILNDKTGAISYIQPIQDELKRKGIWNHTIIVNLKDYFNSTEPARLFADKFFQYTDKLPKKLPTLKVDENVSTSQKRIES
jgi:hypothetical protein